MVDWLINVGELSATAKNLMKSIGEILLLTDAASLQTASKSCQKVVRAKSMKYKPVHKQRKRSTTNEYMFTHVKEIKSSFLKPPGW